MNAPQIIWIVLATAGLTHSLIQHGKPKTGKYNFPAHLIAAALVAALLWWGGFFGGSHG